MISSKVILGFLLFTITIQSVFSQRLITGRVLDINTKVKLDQVAVTIYKGTSNTTTNQNGYFQLTVEKDDTLVLMHPDYKVNQIAVPEVDVFAIYLEKVDSYPVYLEGNAKLYTYLEQNLRYSPNLQTKKNEGVLLLQLTINEKGEIEKCLALNKFIDKYEQNATSVFENIPGSWSPSLEVKTFIFPILYKFRNSTHSIKWPQIVLPEAKIMDGITLYAEGF